MPIADPTSMPFTDLSDPIMFSDPFPRYAELRRTSPVSRVRHREMRRIDAYMLTRYDDVLALHTDARFSSCAASHGAGGVRMRFLPKTFRLLTDSMVYKDDPEHKRLRSLVNNAFTPKRVQQMSGDVQRIVGNLVDRIASTGTTDLVADLAVPLPLSVIATMLGVDDRHRDQFKSAVELMAEASTSGSTRDLTKVLSNGRRVRLMLDRLARQRRSTPDEGLISALV
ncbi:MAG: cytochrome P450 family protein, partial [Acidimicrobiia bacterium]